MGSRWMAKSTCVRVGLHVYVCANKSTVCTRRGCIQAQASHNTMAVSAYKRTQNKQNLTCIHQAQRKDA